MSAMSARKRFFVLFGGGSRLFVQFDYAFGWGRGAVQVLSFDGRPVGCGDAFLAFSGAAGLDSSEDDGGLAGDRTAIWKNAKGARVGTWLNVSGDWLAPISRVRNGKDRVHPYGGVALFCGSTTVGTLIQPFMVPAGLRTAFQQSPTSGPLQNGMNVVSTRHPAHCLPAFRRFHCRDFPTAVCRHRCSTVGLLLQGAGGSLVCTPWLAVQLFGPSTPLTRVWNDGVGVGRRPGSGGHEGGGVVREDGLGAESDEVGVGGGGECVDGLGGGNGLPAERFGFAALCGVEDEDAVGKGGDAGVAAGGGGGGGTAEGVGEGGEEKEAAGGEGIAPGAGDAHVGEAAGGADYDGWQRGRSVGGLGYGLAQEEFEEFFLDGGLEAADEGDGVDAQGAGEVVTFDDEVAGALDGAEEGNRLTVKEGLVADESDGGTSCGFGAGAKGRGRVGRTVLKSCNLQGKVPL